MAGTEAKIRRRLVVRGVVQGVFFRDSCRAEARAAGVAGSVANLDDGSVEIVLEGLAEAVDRVVEWAHRGPDYARVQQVEVSVEGPVGVEGFIVLGVP